MQAAFITGHGGNDVVQVGERSLPARAPGQVRVRMQAATLNQVDLYMRNSGVGITHQLPQILGLDGAGIVQECDSNDPLLRPGQEVVIHPGVACGRCEFCQGGDSALCARIQFLGEHRDGTFAQWVQVPAAQLFPKPAHLDWAEAAALGVNHLTAWRMLFSKARLQPWETVLIFGIGGGVSLAGLQLAQAIGARVIVTSREDGKLERARLLGAAHGINSRTQDVAKEVLSLTGGRGVDVVLENVGEAVWPSALKSLVRGGRLVTCGATTGDQPGADLAPPVRAPVADLRLQPGQPGRVSRPAPLRAAHRPAARHRQPLCPGRCAYGAELSGIRPAFRKDHAASWRCLKATAMGAMPGSGMAPWKMKIKKQSCQRLPSKR